MCAQAAAPALVPRKAELEALRSAVELASSGQSNTALESSERVVQDILHAHSKAARVG